MMANNKPTVKISAYLPPHKQITSEYMYKLVPVNTRIIVNSKHTSWNSRIRNTNGNNLYQHNTKKQHYIITAQNDRRGDIFILSNIPETHTIKTEQVLDSVLQQLENWTQTIKNQYIKKTSWTIYTNQVENEKYH